MILLTLQKQISWLLSELEVRIRENRWMILTWSNSCLISVKKTRVKTSTESMDRYISHLSSTSALHRNTRSSTSQTPSTKKQLKKTLKMNFTTVWETRTLLGTRSTGRFTGRVNMARTDQLTCSIGRASLKIGQQNLPAIMKRA